MKCKASTCMPHPNRQRADLTKHAHLGNKVPAPRILRAASRRQHCVTFRRQFNQIESIHPSIHHSTSTSTSTAKSNPTTILCADCQVSFCSRTSLIQHRMMEHWVFSMHPFFLLIKIEMPCIDCQHPHCVSATAAAMFRSCKHSVLP